MLFKSSQRYFYKRPLQLFLTILGIALGVAVYVGIELSTYSAKTGFLISQQQISGISTHRITGGINGVDERILVTLKKEIGVEIAAPVIKAYAAATDYNNQTVTILGIDPFSETALRNYETTLLEQQQTLLDEFLLQHNAVIMTSEQSDRLGLQPGRQLSLRLGDKIKQVRLLTTITPDTLVTEALKNTLIMDIATAQELLDSFGYISHIDLLLTEPLIEQGIVEKIEAILPADHDLVDLKREGGSEIAMLESFELNLKALSLLAMLVGAFLIYNTMMFAVIQRRELYARFRALGLTRSEVLSQILIEAFTFGLISTLLGAMMGIGLSQFLIQLVSRTINDLYFVTEVSSIYWHWSMAVKAALLGIGVTLIAAAYPAWEACNTRPQHAMQRFAIEQRKRSNNKVLLLISLLFALITLIGLHLSDSLFSDFASIICLFISVALIVPWLARIIVPRIAKQLGVVSYTAKMGCQNIVNNLSRTVVAIAALAVAVATALSMSIMIESFRATVDSWLSGYLKADIFISPIGVDSNMHHSLLDKEVIDIVQDFPEVSYLSQGRRIYPKVKHTGDKEIIPELMILELPETSFSAFQLKQGEYESSKLAYFDQEAVLISEPYATKHDLAVGSKLELKTPNGYKAFNVVGIFYDYGSEQGVLSMSRSTYIKHWQDYTINSIGLYLKEESNVQTVLEKLHKKLAAYQLHIIDRRALHDVSLVIFDRTFAITRVLNILVMLVAFVGILASLMAIQMERLRENAVLRAIGFVPAQIRVMVATETFVMGLLASLLAIPLGILLAYILVHYINFHAFGWTLQWQVPSTLLIKSLLLSIFAALLAGIYPAYRMTHAHPALALRGE
jgi:putative ABC transport system permease protein